MTQVTFEDDRLWTALGTAVTFDGRKIRAGIAYFVLNVGLVPAGVRASVMKQGYLADGDVDLSFPAVGVTRGLWRLSH